jgi:hypothetical protein
MITMILPSFIGLAYLFFITSCYFKDCINPKVMSENLFYTALHLVFFNLFILCLPIIVNVAWLGFSALNGGGVFNNFVTLFESFSLLSWFAYSAYIGIFIITYCIKLIENITNKKRGQ